MTKEFSEGEVSLVAEELVREYGETNLWLFKGEVGAGKTTLIKSVVKAKGLLDDVSSPTFGIVNTYGKGKHQIHHFDLYRVESLEELEEMGFGTYLDSGLCLVEWPELLATELEPPFLLIELEKLNSSTRKLNTRLILD